MKQRIADILDRALAAAVAEGRLDVTDIPAAEVELPREEAHGDYAANLAMVLASRAKKPPRQIAQILLECLPANDVIEKVEIAGPGFLNFFLRKDVWAAGLEAVEQGGPNYGRADWGKGKRVQVEFVSANPTGPLHIGHARGAVVGDVIAGLMEAVGYEVYREYYINDAGNQMFNLGKSVFYRYLEASGRTVGFPETCYQGDYIRDIAQGVAERDGKIYLNMVEEEAVPGLTDYAAGIILEGIQEDLRIFGVVFDQYFSERELYADGVVQEILEGLEAKGVIYRDEGGTRWFKTTDYGDEKDRVVVRQNGDPTYFAADIAYHRNKFDRGFDRVIDIWGADHHGYIPRVMASLDALGIDRAALKVILVQMVNLLRDGKPVAMSTRSGEFVTLREVVDEVGKDAARYNFLMRRSDSHLDFDLEVAKRQSNENPVYYVQYAHARIASILRLAAEKGIAPPVFRDAACERLTLPEEIDLIQAVTRFPGVVDAAARTLEPHRLTFYANELAGLFHSYYNKHKVVSEDMETTKARLFLAVCVRTVLVNALTLLGVSAPDKM